MTTHDVAIIGGGPAGSTCGSLLKKYNPDLRVAILEKETFPREHVGESQLPLIGSILNEMGCWEKIEQAEFPIKLGATYRWGQSDELWDFEFIPFDEFRDEPRPAKFQGQRMFTAFQVDRARYDQILLDHAQELGCDVRQNTLVRTIEHEGDRVTALRTEGGDEITATHYIDASGGVGVLRRAMGVGVTHPGSLKNIAMWDYWENAEWAVTIGTGGTRVFVLSIGCGWIWFIPIGKTRVSIGFICPKEYYAECGKSIDELYEWALAQEPLVQKHTRNATREGTVHSTKDWSFISDRMLGENWFLAGESCGFADPILAGGMMLTHAGARELAYTILELERGNHEREWLLDRYQDLQRRRMMQHIRFADFWYAGNGQFTDLESLTQAIANDAGIKLEPKDAFRWLSNGGFLEDIPGRAGLGG
ncbi:MAG: tryptophan 7-halogenase, partial [Phycisphaerales bacterium]|nr:tryptophan 7-halogenase [Phycisphaerales bacterium]